MNRMHLYKTNQNTSSHNLKKKLQSHANFKKTIRTKKKKKDIKQMQFSENK